ncbi:MAG: preprotein translocase subunit SecE [candidate division NC10 bacterium]
MTPPKEYLDRAIRYLKEVRAELRKVTWPQRKEVIGSTVVVIAATFVVSFFLGGVDLVLAKLLVLVIR